MKLKSALPLCTTVAVLAGCADVTPVVDRHFGEAFAQAKVGQTIDPQAAQHPGRTVGIDGAAARETMKRYVDSFKAPPPSINVINIGGSIGGGGGGQ